MKLFKIFILLLAAVILSGCIPGEDKAIMQAVRNYNNSLPLALESQDNKVLEHVATEKEMGRVMIFISQMKKEKKIVQSSLQYLEFGRVKLKKQNIAKADPKYNKAGSISDKKVLPQATMKTIETWSFSYLDMNTRKPVNRQQKVKYAATYQLVKKDGKWLVDELEFKESLVK